MRTNIRFVDSEIESKSGCYTSSPIWWSWKCWETFVSIRQASVLGLHKLVLRRTSEKEILLKCQFAGVDQSIGENCSTLSLSTLSSEYLQMASILLGQFFLFLFIKNPAQKSLELNRSWFGWLIGASWKS